METHQSEASWLTGLMQPMQHKLQQILQSLEARSSKHITFNRIEKLVTQEEEVIEEVAKVQQMVKELQDKVSPQR